MRVRILKGIVNPTNGGKYHVGQTLKVTLSYGRELIAAKKAVEYKDGLPIKKLKSDFFKPKEIKQ
jgi:hypothetical protein